MTMHDKAAPAAASLAPLFAFVELLDVLLLPASQKHPIMLFPLLGDRAADS